MMIMEGQAPYTPEEKTEDKKPKKPKFHETTPFWMIIAAIITFLIITVVYYGHYHRYTADNPPELTMDMVHDLVGDVFTAHQWEIVDLAQEDDRIEISHYMDGTVYRVNVHGPFLSGQEVATIIIYWSSYEQEYSLNSVEWKAGCACGCDICEEECA